MSQAFSLHPSNPFPSTCSSVPELCTIQKGLEKGGGAITTQATFPTSQNHLNCKFSRGALLRILFPLSLN